MRRALLLLALASFPACGDQPPPRNAPPSLLETVPVPPGARRLTASSGAQAVVAEYSLIGLPDSVAAWYRRWFFEHAWRIVGDTRLPDGTFSIHADSQARPVWLLVRAAPGGARLAVMVAEPEGPR